MDARKEKINGKFEYKDKEYPFVLEDQIVTIPQIPFEYTDDFEGVPFIETLHGVTSSNQNIYLLKCEVVVRKVFSIPQTITITVMGYVLMSGRNDSIDRADFYSEAINAFYSPKNAYSIDYNEDRTRVVTIKMREKAMYRQTAACCIDGEDLSINLDIDVAPNQVFEDESMGIAQTVMSVEFKSKKQPHDICQYYLYIKDFLEFVNSRRDIPLDRINLFARRDHGGYVRCGRAVIYNIDCSSFRPSLSKSITYADITPECFPALISRIAEKRARNKRSQSFYPMSRQDSRTVDNAKWLNTAICFEGEFNEVFPNYKAERDQAFYQAKTILLSAIDTEVQKSGLSIRNDANKAWYSFKHMISHADTTIKEKFLACEEQYWTEIQEMFDKVRKQHNIPDEVDFAQEYSDLRNSTSHGDILLLQEKDIATYRLLRCFVYVMNLKATNVPTDNIKDILNRMF